MFIWDAGAVWEMGGQESVWMEKKKKTKACGFASVENAPIPVFLYLSLTVF